MAVLSMIAGSVLLLYSALVSGTITSKRRAVALGLATNQMEYLKSLPYNNLAIAGGSIPAANPLPASSTQTLDNVDYTVRSDINYIDDAFDGCANYPSQQLKELYCRNYPPPSSTVDSNPADYKVIHVAVYDKNNAKLADVDTQVAARVAETASTTGALFVKVIDGDGNNVDGASVHVTNSTTAPALDVTDSTDSNGVAIFYGLTPDTNGYDYVINASKSNYSSLSTIGPSGVLQATYQSQQVFTQQSSFSTLTIKPQSANSLVLETTDTSGSPIGNAKVYLKGGYKKYTDSADTSYYYDTMTPSDTRPQTNGGGIATVSNLVPGAYVACGDSGSTSCTIGGTTYYLAAAVPYGGTNAFGSIVVPTYDPLSPPTTTFSEGGVNYLQKARLLLTTQSSHPRISSLEPREASLSTSNMGAFDFVITGHNLPCNAVAASCATSVKFTQGATNYPASCVGDASGLQLNCTANMTGASVGLLPMSVTANGFTFNLPGSPLQGGMNVTP